MKKTILSIVGTRPDCIKMAPVIKEVEKRKPYLKSVVVATSQHVQMLSQVLESFNIKVDYDLKVMRPNQTLSEVTQRCIIGLDKLITKINPDLVVVQGDTTTSFIGALVAFYHKMPIAHVEAGMRTFDKFHPFPEELNRIFIDDLSDILLAATQTNKTNLYKEGRKKENISVTGNTAIDALLSILRQPYSFQNEILKKIDFRKQRVITVTAHRRESFGSPFQQLLLALKELAQKYKNIQIVYPVHLNPNVRKPTLRVLKNVSRVHLLPPLNYIELVNLLKKSYIILTDSGGIQEEAPTLGKPVLVLRNVTERTEGIKAGTAKLTGMHKKKIVFYTSQLLEDIKAYQKMAKVGNPYGDGRASQRIVNIFLKYFGLPYQKIPEFRFRKL